MTAPSGVRWYVSAPGYGKTTRALRDARALVAEHGYPLLVIDSASADQLAAVPHGQSVKETLKRVWGQGLHTAFAPESVTQVEALLSAAFAAGQVVLLVDETAFWMTSRRGTSTWLLRLMRSHRHARAWLLLTTQSLSGDMPQEAWACAPELYVSRTTSPTALDLLWSRFGLEPETVQRLAVGTFLEAHKALDNAPERCSPSGMSGGPAAAGVVPATPGHTGAGPPAT